MVPLFLDGHRHPWLYRASFISWLRTHENPQTYVYNSGHFSEKILAGVRGPAMRPPGVRPLKRSTGVDIFVGHGGGAGGSPPLAAEQRILHTADEVARSPHEDRAGEHDAAAGAQMVGMCVVGRVRAHLYIASQHRWRAGHGQSQTPCVKNNNKAAMSGFLSFLRANR